MMWEMSYRADPRARVLADRHYSRQTIGATGFVPPGRCLVLYAQRDGKAAYWVTSYPFAEYVRHAWAGAWMCSAFRNEGVGLSSDLIREAVAATRAHFGEPPPLGMVTFVDASRPATSETPDGAIEGLVSSTSEKGREGLSRSNFSPQKCLRRKLPCPRKPLLSRKKWGDGHAGPGEAVSAASPR